jgi:broad-specificity NMP kinase
MSLIFVTGVPGSGKSAVEIQLRKRGYTSYDADSIGAAYNIEDGLIVKIPPASERSPEWFQAHQWKVQRDRVEQLKEKSKNKTIFLCGTASNDEELWDLFDQVFMLHVDEASLKHRIATRKDNDYGKNEYELTKILEKYRNSFHKYDLPKVIVIDASQPLMQVVQTIIDSL